MDMIRLGHSEGWVYSPIDGLDVRCEAKDGKHSSQVECLRYQTIVAHALRW